MKHLESKIPSFSEPHGELRKAQEAMKRIREGLTPVIDEHMRKISETMRGFPDKAKRLLKNLAEKGWFLPLDITIPAVYHLAELIESNDEKEINRLLVKFYTERLDEVLNSLVATYPDRAHLFRSAFKAHNCKEYDLSIPVLLAQADGVCYDMLKVKLFSRECAKPKTKEALEKEIGSIRLVSICDLFLEPLRSGSALMLNPNQMKQKRDSIPEYRVLNRHEIMHGVDKNYGSEVNSLKAIAQLDYLRDIREILKDHKKWKEQFVDYLTPKS
jgi:hypothetical protein